MFNIKRFRADNSFIIGKSNVVMHDHDIEARPIPHIQHWQITTYGTVRYTEVNESKSILACPPRSWFGEHICIKNKILINILFLH